MPLAVWTPKAERDLEDILYYIRVTAGRPLTAQRIGEELVAAVEQQVTLASPGSRHLAAPPEWRYLRYKRWLVFYSAAFAGD